MSNIVGLFLAPKLGHDDIECYILIKMPTHCVALPFLDPFEAGVVPFCRDFFGA